MKIPCWKYLLFSALVLTVSCAEEDCTNLDDPLLTIEFKTRFTTAAGQQRERDTSLVVRHVYGVGKSPQDSLVRPGTYRNLILPVNQRTDTTSFRILYYPVSDASRTVRTGTISLRYRRQSFFVSDVCGFNIRYNDLDTIRAVMPLNQSLVIFKNTVDEANTPNIRIYF
jgi:hypothetical protein